MGPLSQAPGMWGGDGLRLASAAGAGWGHHAEGTQVPGCPALAQLAYRQVEMRRLHSGKEVRVKWVKGGGWRVAGSPGALGKLLLLSLSRPPQPPPVERGTQPCLAGTTHSTALVKGGLREGGVRESHGQDGLPTGMM